MLCPNCHTENADGNKFCETCGTPLAGAPAPAAPAAGASVPTPSGVALPPIPMPATVAPAPAAAAEPESDETILSANVPVEDDATVLSSSAPAPAAPAPAPAPEPVAPTPEPVAPAAPAAPAQDAPATETSTATVTEPAPAPAKAKRGPNKLIIILAVALVALIAAGVALFLTYRAEVWGGKSLPDPASFSSSVTDKNGKKTSAVKAKDVTAALKAKGLKVKTEKVFSGKDSGVFVGYKDNEAGARVAAGSTVTVQESAGPGVPKDTIGKKAEKTTSTFVEMGVPVHYKKVYVSDTKTNPEGTVVSSYPAAGTGVKDDERDKGIYLGVATKSDGSALPLDVMGQSVDDVKSQLESEGHTVTVKKRFSSKQYVGKVAGADPAPGSTMSSSDDVTLYEGIDATSTKDAFKAEDLPEINGDAMLGTTDAADGQWCTNDGKCITIEDNKVVSGGSDYSDYGQYGNYLVACDAIQQPYCSNTKADYLVTQDYGAFELMPYPSLTNYWSNGKMYSTNGVGGNRPTSGEYHMQDLFLVVPTGSDLEGLEGSKGYFDADALAAAKKEKAVDTDRPFILWRDPSQYDTTTAPYKAGGNTTNPFLPYDGYSSNRDSIVKMKPAPSDATAYYRVETTEPDWDSLPDADVKVPESKDASNADSTDSDSKDSESDEPDAASLKVFSDLAGSQYSYTIAADGSAYTTISLDEKGNFSGTVDEADMKSGEPTATAPRIKTKFTGKFKSAKSNSDGTVTLECDASAFKIDDTSKATESGFSPCGTFTGYPAGTDLESLPEDAQSLMVKRGSMDGPSDWLLANDGGKGTFIRTEK
ncbi:PASTA domain-containing protein [Bifidobacterium olomucense]|uniref:Transmembrane serine/threonine- protein kinase B n=1 Tax=Bifidobacterium olomucense TaxID=2675324 RepID=A0A7Y0EY86_9BIFI|nr:PASTA domain-containing protein [Bifidobacterium sp. DSM 109959]NMM98562.1 transmembrane serine/threonine- protein kinase B [Bifidobacterium sp. DSM 109959]